MTLFMTLGWESFGGAGLLLISLVYLLLALGLTEYLLARGQLAIPAGITGALAIVMVPLAVYAAQHILGLWPPGAAYRDYHAHIDWRWIMMELATLAAGAAALWRYRLTFMVLPMAVSLWYLSMDLTPFLFEGGAGGILSDRGKLVSVWFGLAMIALAFQVDVRTRTSKDFAFWLYVFGTLAFWCGLTSMDSNSELNKFLYCCINLMMIALGTALLRRVLVVFGGIGVTIYLGYLSYSLFKNSLLFPLALTVIGLSMIAAGVWWQRREAAIGARLRSFLPAFMRDLIMHRSG
jgi:hypothetical protein